MLASHAPVIPHSLLLAYGIYQNLLLTAPHPIPNSPLAYTGFTFPPILLASFMRDLSWPHIDNSMYQVHLYVQPQMSRMRLAVPP